MSKQLIVRFLSVMLTVALAMPVAGVSRAACPMQMGMHTAAAMQMQKSDGCPLCHKHQGMKCAHCTLCIAPASMALLTSVPGVSVTHVASRSFDALNVAMTGDMPLPEFPPPRA